MEQLEKYFDTAFEAPDGVDQLRGLILTIALQGKLVPQDPLDKSSGEVLLNLKDKLKEKYATITKSNKRTSSTNQNLIPYPIPSNWKWVNLSEIGEINPRNNVDDNLDAGFVPMTLIKAKYGVSHSFEVRKWKTIRSGFTHFSNQDIGLAKITPCFENAKSCVFTNLPNGIGAGTTELHIFRNTFGLVHPEYLLAYFKSPKFISEGIKKMTGSAGQKRVPTDYFSSNPFPLPPIKEQHRIVKKIDELMSRCDELEKLRAERDQKRLAVHTAAIRKMLDALDQETFDVAWQFITRHFGDLYTVRENVAELRKAILHLAVMGKLVKQDAKEGTARELMEKIERERRRMVKDGKMKEPKPLPPIKSEEIPFEVPGGWELTRFLNVNTIKSELVTALAYPNEYQIAPDSIEKNKGRLIEDRTVKQSGATGPNNKFYKGQILYSKIRPSLNKVVIAPYNGLCSADMYPLVCHCDTEFMLKVMLSEIFLKQVRLAENRIKMPKLNIESLGSFVIPLPPLREQRRISQKVDYLMAQCDTLEKTIDILREKQGEVLEAVITDEFNTPLN